MQEPGNVATGRAIIFEIARAMRENLEPLVFSTIAPTRFYVYLHPDDYRRLEGIFPLLVEQAGRTLDEEVRRANQRSAGDALRRWLSKDAARPPIETPRDGWDVRFEPDLDGEMQPGDIAVASELFLPAPAELAGSRTRRVTTLQSGGKTSRREQVVGAPSGTAQPPGQAPGGQAAAEGTVVATLTYEDQQGPHCFSMMRNEIVVGRGGVGYWVDVKVHSSPDISREHLRIRRDPASGQFYLKDLSTLGTTIDGQGVASSIELVDGRKRDKGIEVALPPHARIGLAGLLVLQFDAGGPA